MDYSMQEKCSLVGKEGQAQLNNATVSIVGLGGVGTTVAEILLRNGVNLRIVDRDRVLAKDMPRTNLYLAQDINKFKAKQAKKRLEEVSKEVKIKTFHEELHADNAFLLKADLIIDASNNEKTSMLVNDYAIQEDIPVLFCNYAGALGNVVLLRPASKQSPCFLCIQEKVQVEKLSKAGLFSPLTNFLGGMLSSIAMKQLLNKASENILHAVDLKQSTVKSTPIQHNENCSACGKK